MIRPSEEVIEGLDADQLELQTIFAMGKPMEFFKTEVIMWQEALGLMGDTVSVWEVVSKTWAALESIFLASEDIRSQLPDDTKRFEGIHNEFVELMKDAVNETNCKAALTVDGREAQLRGIRRSSRCARRASTTTSRSRRRSSRASTSSPPWRFWTCSPTARTRRRSCLTSATVLIRDQGSDPFRPVVLFCV